jgi:ubiquinone/menaquinone biosynthesis C-methylase UbiE
MNQYSYEESVHWLRRQPEYTETVKQCYLDEDNLAAAERFAASDEFAAVVALLRLDPRDGCRRQILDLGCGNGIVSYAFACLGNEVSALDPDLSDDVGLRAAERLATVVPGGSISTHHGFAEELPFGDETFDVVYTRQALHHFSDLHKGLRECSRVLKKGGLLLATREHIVDDARQLEQFLEEHLLHKLHGGENAYPLDVYTNALEQAPFRVVRCLHHFDSVINYFPMSEEEVRHLWSSGLQNKYGVLPAKMLAGLPPAERFFRGRLSRRFDHPGRFCSFLCQKP